MLKMRLQRIGRKNNPSYRVIVTDARNAAKRGRSIDLLGSFDPKGGKFQVDAEKVRYWISKGVQVSDTVHNFLVTQKIVEGKKKNALPKKTPVVNEAKVKAEADAKATLEAKEKAEQEAQEKAKEEAKETAPEDATPVEEATAEEIPADSVSGEVEEQKVA